MTLIIVTLAHILVAITTVLSNLPWQYTVHHQKVRNGWARLKVCFKFYRVHFSGQNDLSKHTMVYIVNKKHLLPISAS